MATKKTKRTKSKSPKKTATKVASSSVVVPKAARAKSNGARTRAGAALVRGVEASARAVELRARAYTFDEIGRELGMSGEGARKAVSRGLMQTIVASKERADELRAEESERLMRLLGELRPIVEAEADPALKVRAIGEARQISARLSALHGLDAPTRTQVTGKDGGPIQHAIGSLADMLRIGLEREPDPQVEQLAEVIDATPVLDAPPEESPEGA